jgi:hypothetical protein
VNIEILDEAQGDLIQGFCFYENWESGLGAYFLDCLFSDIDSLLVYGGVHAVTYAYHRCLSKRFHLRFTTVWKGSWFACMLY